MCVCVYLFTGGQRPREKFVLLVEFIAIAGNIAGSAVAAILLLLPAIRSFSSRVSQFSILIIIDNKRIICDDANRGDRFIAGPPKRVCKNIQFKNEINIVHTS